MFFAAVRVALCLSLLGVFLGAPVDASPTQRRVQQYPGRDLNLTTNAQRLAHGLSPLPPRSLFPTKTSKLEARQADPSSLPPGTKCIEIKRKSDSASLGYLSENFDPSYGMFVRTTNKAQCLRVFTPEEDASEPFDVPIVDATGTQIYLGLARNQNSLAQYFAVPVKTVHSVSTADGDNSAYNPNTFFEFRFSESVVWSRSGASGLLSNWMVDFPTAHYISAPVYMIPSQPNWVLFALDDAEFKRNFSGSTELVLSFVDPI